MICHNVERKPAAALSAMAGRREHIEQLLEWRISMNSEHCFIEQSQYEATEEDQLCCWVMSRLGLQPQEDQKMKASKETHANMT